MNYRKPHLRYQTREKKCNSMRPYSLGFYTRHLPAIPCHGLVATTDHQIEISVDQCRSASINDFTLDSAYFISLVDTPSTRISASNTILQAPFTALDLLQPILCVRTSRFDIFLLYGNLTSLLLCKPTGMTTILKRLPIVTFSVNGSA